MSNSKIRAELETRLKAWADAQTPTIPIAFENVPFTKPDSGFYLEPFLLPNTTLNRDLSGKRKTYVGLFQINCWSRDGMSMIPVEALVDKIVRLFPMLPKTGTVSIEATPDAGKPLRESGWVIVPVTVRYRMESF